MTDAGPLSPSSTLAASEQDDPQTTQTSSPTRPDPRSSLRHVLESTQSGRTTPLNSIRPPPLNNNDTMTEDDEPFPTSNPDGVPSSFPPTTTTPSASVVGGPRGKRTKDPAAAAASTYSGNKVRHLKKDDGEPLWRRDIQYDFLKAVFDDDRAVFTNSYEPEVVGKQTFADLYIDAMARSSKTSKILRDKLLSEHEPAKNMAMVCLLVNLGRMNTTLNFFPEMRAQLRTYHAIPSLQAHQDPNSYKQLQDAPRLKSILKGASEDRPEPNSLEKIKFFGDPPRTNPVNLIFVLSNYSPKATELHFPPGHDFYDLIMRTSLSSASRARAFLWLMWFYLESDFTEEGADENPFGPGVDYNTRVANQGVPRFDILTPEQEAAENVDTTEEIEFGQAKMRERKRIIEADQIALQTENGPPKRGPKPKLHLPPEDAVSSPGGPIGRIRPKFEDGTASPATIINRIRPKYESDMDSTRSTPPPRGLHHPRLNTALKGRGTNSLKHQLLEGSSPVGANEGSTRRSRPMTAHQLAVEHNRNQRVEYILSRGLRKEHHKARKIRRREGALVRALRRTEKVGRPLEDSEGENNGGGSMAALLGEEYALEGGRRGDKGEFREKGFGGLVQLADEMDDFGEEMAAYAAAFRRAGRRLRRWDGSGGVGEDGLALGVVGTRRLIHSHPHSHSRSHNPDDEDAELDDSHSRTIPGGAGGVGAEGYGAYGEREEDETEDDDEDDEIDYEHQQRLEQLRLAMEAEVKAHRMKKKQKRMPRGGAGGVVVVKEKATRGTGVGKGRGRGSRGGRGGGGRGGRGGRGGGAAVGGAGLGGLGGHAVEAPDQLEPYGEKAEAEMEAKRIEEEEEEAGGIVAVGEDSIQVSGPSREGEVAKHIGEKGGVGNGVVGGEGLENGNEGADADDNADEDMDVDVDVDADANMTPSGYASAGGYGDMSRGTKRERDAGDTEGEEEDEEDEDDIDGDGDGDGDAIRVEGRF